MVEQSRNLSPKDYAIQKGKEIIGIDAVQDYLRRARESSGSISFTDGLWALQDGLAQGTGPLSTEHFRREPYRSLYDRPLGERLSIATKIVLDLSSMFFPITSVMHGNYELAIISTGVKIFGYNLVVAIAPDIIKGVKQKLPHQK